MRGIYYIPGTDICMRIGGYVRQEWGYGYGDNLTQGPFISTSMQNTRIDGTRELVWRTRAYITQETRQQTQYGTLRTFLNLGVNGNNTFDFSANRAFIQIAGFTAGLASSYFDHYSVAAIAYLVDQSSDTGDGGRAVFAYTAQLGNGISASIAAEEPESKRAGVWNTNIATNNLIASSTAAGPPFATTATGVTGLVIQPVTGPQLGIAGTAQGIQDQKHSIMPDIVANIRVDGAWGSAQVMGAIHEVSGGYFGQSKTGSTAFGRPTDAEIGFAVGVGSAVQRSDVRSGRLLRRPGRLCGRCVRATSPTPTAATVRPSSTARPRSAMGSGPMACTAVRALPILPGVPQPASR